MEVKLGRPTPCEKCGHYNPPGRECYWCAGYISLHPSTIKAKSMIKIREDVICPIACGCCCIDCENLTPHGCGITDRTKRPMACNAWMCGEGTMAFNDKEEDIAG